MFDASRFLTENFRSPDGVLHALAKVQPELPERETVRKWFSRGSVPGEWSFLLVVALELENGRPARLADYVPREAADDIFQ